MSQPDDAKLPYAIEETPARLGRLVADVGEAMALCRRIIEEAKRDPTPGTRGAAGAATLILDSLRAAVLNAERGTPG